MTKNNPCICNNADRCNSPTCPHKSEHPYDPKWCGPGGCRWAKDTMCVRAIEQEVMAILSENFQNFLPEQSTREVAREIVALFDKGGRDGLQETD
ncbi:MAG: hypothetical protein A4E65_01158 [Syntrophorhabdus sp. PtaU1.Bin153]|nr:MAG: hypothetical protein A4E65_01158 [Syntrophorhabdus sp. PtaU1.Bin153]